MSIGSRCQWKVEQNGETRFPDIVLEMGLTEVFFPYGNYQGSAYVLFGETFHEILMKVVFI